MTTKAIYINLPINNVDHTRKFWSALGFNFNEQFSNETALCLEIKKDCIYAMLVMPEHFATFTNRPISDRKTTQVILAVELNSKVDVDKTIQLACEHGAQKFKEAVDYDWMYYDSFTDIDGHQWELMYTDFSKMQTQ